MTIQQRQNINILKLKTIAIIKGEKITKNTYVEVLSK